MPYFLLLAKGAAGRSKIRFTVKYIFLYAKVTQSSPRRQWQYYKSPPSIDLIWLLRSKINNECYITSLAFTAFTSSYCILFCPSHHGYEAHEQILGPFQYKDRLSRYEAYYYKDTAVFKLGIPIQGKRHWNRPTRLPLKWPFIYT